MENFSDVLSKVKEIHEKEVLGLQTKLTELTMEKCRDTRRIEELFAKNHLLREQQKALNENIKALENRLRAGLCDRCTVTQDLAKKKQKEFEGSHLQSLQLLSSLTNELKALKEENASLREELRKLRNLETQHPGVLSPGRGFSPDLPGPLGGRKSLERPPGKESEVAPFPPAGEEKSFGPESSAAAVNSPVRTMQDMCMFEFVPTNPQRIANQLHGTIAVVRPGSKSCLSERISAPSAMHAQSNHARPLRGNSPHFCEQASGLETLKQGSREEQLCLWTQRFSHGMLGLQSPGVPADGLLGHVPKARELEAVRRRSQSEREEPAAVLERQRAVTHPNEQSYWRRCAVAEQREKLQYFLARQQQQHQERQRARAEALPNQTAHQACQEEAGRTLPQASWASENRRERRWSEDREERCSVFTSAKLPAPGEKQGASSSHLPDKPLDLSDSGRMREALCSARQHKPFSPGPPAREGSASPQDGTGANALQRGGPEKCLLGLSQVHAGSPFDGDGETHQLAAAPDGEDFAPSLEARLSPQGDSSESSPDVEPGSQLLYSSHRQKQDMKDPDEDEDKSTKRDSDEPDASDSEATGPETERTQQSQVQEREYFCIKDKARRKRRKRGAEHWAKGHTKPNVKGSKKAKGVQSQMEEALGGEKESSYSSSSSEDVQGET
ncbi:RBBP8 N-terminal-like protein [Rhinatrema bivittatum]|uniref:RBBP8 N-terminal-like protein n=1 Tax=Rhinatrema bivittatum TaxID=194408 RepID=UPI0011269FD4|nr:RBBP8 N-terminal-like protein [Rhinatrema bivittatum]